MSVLLSDLCSFNSIFLRGKYFFRLVSEALQTMDGKFLEIAGSHVAARVLQVSLNLFFLPSFHCK